MINAMLWFLRAYPRRNVVLYIKIIILEEFNSFLINSAPLDCVWIDFNVERRNIVMVCNACRSNSWRNVVPVQPDGVPRTLN